MDAGAVTKTAMTEAVGAIYDASLSPDAWPRALSHIKAMLSLANTAYLVRDVDRTRIERVTAENDPEGQRLNVELLLRTNRPLLGDSTGYPGQVIRMAEYLPARSFLASTMYQQFWRPRQLHDGLRLTVAIDAAGIHHAVNLHRTKSAGIFEQRDIALAHRLMPHLRRAVAVRRRLGQADLLASSALRILDGLPHAVLLLDQTGRVLHGNARADRMLAAGDGLTAVDGVLRALAQPATKRLHDVLARAAGFGRQPAAAGALRLPRPDQAIPLALLAIPLRREHAWTLPGDPAILLTIADPHASTSPATRHLAEVFGLTQAEASLAGDLLAGLDTREIAARRGRSLATVRTHLARLMAKANVNRQSELMRVLANVPRSLDDI